MSDCSSSVIPNPVSVTVVSMIGDSWLSDLVIMRDVKEICRTVDLSVNLMALETRFMSTCEMRSGSECRIKFLGMSKSEISYY